MSPGSSQLLPPPLSNEYNIIIYHIISCNIVCYILLYYTILYTCTSELGRSHARARDVAMICRTRPGLQDPGQNSPHFRPVADPHEGKGNYKDPVKSNF